MRRLGFFLFRLNSFTSSGFFIFHCLEYFLGIGITYAALWLLSILVLVVVLVLLLVLVLILLLLIVVFVLVFVLFVFLLILILLLVLFVLLLILVLLLLLFQLSNSEVFTSFVIIGIFAKSIFIELYTFAIILGVESNIAQIVKRFAGKVSILTLEDQEPHQSMCRLPICGKRLQAGDHERHL